ncbi:MAG: hypothetical protein VKJ05_09155 [Synechococcaceae cyanobacterium]|nr:hypothetical protein [Synechococcaceae cyanobacterium]
MNSPSPIPPSAPAGAPLAEPDPPAIAAPPVAEPVLCGHCGRTAGNGLVCIGACVADSGY